MNTKQKKSPGGDGIPLWAPLLFLLLGWLMALLASLV